MIHDGEQIQKKKVVFDESQNVIKEFAKNEKIVPLSAEANVFTSPKRGSNKKSTKSEKK